ncbi:endogenous retrovirus group K member 24 Gag polyprotein-like [Peromyscus californicus insignis]|uniref:endogenous retrovirus group K member 24 Gag polyprotein-like n=1 Tax=Peromyscus californicus insignis TaxID=564181 RepID=UPI0022A71E5A|nr:endogenous retrovirus group K member 24 Gag polyprotein-like [Peromyscus californicus insignis]
MGTSSSHPIFLALNELLRSKNLKVKKSTLERFLEECDVVSPWFAVSGSLTIPSWEKVGRDLDFAFEQGTLKAGVRPVWKLVRGCLEDQRCNEAIENGQAALESLQEERSEKANSERASREGKSKGRKGAPIPLYPDLSELEGLEMSNSDEEMTSVIEMMENMGLSRKDKMKEKKGLDKVEREESCMHGNCQAQPLAPSPYTNGGSGGSGHTFSPGVWRTVRTELRLAYPVFQDPQGNRYEEPLDFKVIKSLAESVRTYSTTATFTLAQVEALSRHCMTPSDWGGLAQACLSPGQYLDWKAFLIEFANKEAAANQARGQPAWGLDMLLGQGRFANEQTGYPVQVYEQINKIGIKAWKSLPNKGEVSGNLTKILQGPTETFSDFVARMVEAAGRIFGEPDTTMPLIKQLIYEQCTKECRAAITPNKNRGLEVWMKACRELGEPLTNAGLAAAVVQLTQNK